MCGACAQGFFACFRAVQLLKGASPPGALIVVGLAGPSGAGKTVFGEKLRELLPGSALLSMDMYNDGARVVDANYDDPRLCDYDTLLANLADLRAGRDTQAPVYDFRISKRTGYRHVAFPASRVVLVEGTFALCDVLRPQLDLRVAITGGVHRDLIKRVLRDVTRSGQAPEEIITQITETVHPMFRVFIEPDLQTAHLRIVNAFNPFAGFAAPTYVLKADAASAGLTPAAAAAALGAGCTSEEEQETTDIYLLPPHADAATCATWLRMRAREGRYTIVFEEFVTDGPYIISPNVRYEVNVRVLGGLMALGYTVGAILKRSSLVLTDEQGMVTVKFDTVADLSPSPFVQVQGKLRAAVEEVARRMGIEDAACIPMSYIQQVQARRAAGSGGGAAAAQMPRAPSAADALHLFGVESSAAAAAAGEGAPSEAWAGKGSAAAAAAAASPAEAPVTPGGASPAERRDAGGARLAALSARVDALVDVVAAMQQQQQQQQHLGAMASWAHHPSPAQPQPLHQSLSWPPAATPPPPSAVNAYLAAAMPPATPPGRDAAAVAALARFEAMRAAHSAPQAAAAAALGQAPWERVALAAAAGALVGAAALRLYSAAS